MVEIWWSGEEAQVETGTPARGAETRESTIEDAQLGRRNHRVAATTHTELAVDAESVRLDGLRGDSQLYGDLLVGQPLLQQLQYVEFAAARSGQSP